MNDEQLTAEIKRAFGRYRATPVSLPDLKTSGHPSRAWLRRPAVVRLSAGAVVVAVCLAVAANVLGPFAPGSPPTSVFASWRRVPTSPDPAMASWASSHCSDTKLPLLIQDQRGTASLFVFQEGSTFLDCIVWTIDTPTEKGWFSASSTGDFENTANPIDLWSELGISVAANGSVETAVGRAPGAASVLVVTAEGAEIQASVRDGTFAAWWPSDGIRVAGVREIRSYDARGALVGDLHIPQSSGSPWVLGTPEPTPSGPPVPAGS